MRYPIMIEAGDDNAAWSVIVPDLPGCYSAGDSLDEAVDAVQEAAAAWIDVALDEGRMIPKPSSVEGAVRSGDYDGWIVSYVDVDPSLLDDTIERINITLPLRVLKRLDAKAKEKGLSRSSYIANMAIG